MNARESVQAEAWTQAVTKCIRSRAPILQHSSSALRYCSSRFHRQDGEKHEERIRRPAVACQGVPPSLRRVSCGGDCGLVSGAQPWCGRRDRVDQIGRMDVERSIATGAARRRVIRPEHRDALERAVPCRPWRGFGISVARSLLPRDVRRFRRFCCWRSSRSNRVSTSMR
jgi:hypothetical protein